MHRLGAERRWKVYVTPRMPELELSAVESRSSLYKVSLILTTNFKFKDGRRTKRFFLSLTNVS